ncbi:MAG: YfhO family protein [Ignavibacteria bacterium]|nr:YfhO family protein [Ignavibacteria bacterium]
MAAPLKTSKQNTSNSPISIKVKELTLPIVLLLFAATTMIFFRDILFGNKFFWDDVAEYIYPFTTFAARQLAQFQLPFWNPYTFSGMPFLADFQTQTLYPPHTMMALFLKKDGMLPTKIIEIVIILHFFLAQYAMYSFARFKNVSSYGAIIAAVSYAFCGSLAVRVIHPMVVYHLALFPLILLHFHRGIFEGKIKNTLYAGLLLALALISGHPQTSAYLLLFLAGYTVWMGFGAIKNKELNGGAISRFTLRALLPVIMAFALTAVQFIPAQELAGLSERTKITYDKTPENPKLYASDGSMRLGQIYSAAVANLYGKVSQTDQKQNNFYLPNVSDTGTDQHYYWDTAFYFGLAALCLGLFGLSTQWRSRFGGFMLAMIIFAILYGLGANGFLHRMLFGIPVFGSFRNPGRIMFYMSFGLCLFAGIGFDALWQSAKNSKLQTCFLIASAIPLLITLFAATGILQTFIDTPESATSAIQKEGLTAFFLCLGVVAVGFLLYRKVLPVSGAGWILVFIAFIDLNLAYSQFVGSKENPAEKFKISPELKQQFAITPPNNIFRVEMWSKRGSYAMKRNQGPLDNIMLFEGYNPILLERRSPMAADPNTVEDLLGIRYKIDVDEATQQLGIIERPTAFKRAWMAYQPIVTETDNVVKTMKAGGINYRNQVVLEKSPANSLGNLPSDSISHSVNCTEYTNNQFSYSVKSDKAGILCMSEIWYPAWKATIDGQPAEVLRINYSLRGVEVPAGEHTIVMKYDSDAFHTGAWISLSSLILTLGAVVFFRIKEKNV